MAVRFGGRIRKGAAVTAVAAAAMAALTASQAPGLAAGAVHEASALRVPPGPPIDGGSPYITSLPPLASPNPAGTGTPTTGDPVIGTGAAGLPATVLAAYRQAEDALRASKPGCHLPWQLLAGIGQVESGQARGGNVDLAGTTLKPILGPVLNGGAFANITDTDGGRWDGDAVHDRAVGPMQFIPSTWATWGADGNHDGVKNPNNVYDAALAAGDYLCAVGGDLSQPARMRRAILGYNHSDAYYRTVYSWYEYFLKGVHQVPDNSSGAGITAPSPTPSASASASPSPSASASPSHSPQPTVSASGTIGPGSGSPSAPGSPSTGSSTSAPPSTGPSTGPTCPVTPSAPASPTGSTSPTPTVTPTPSSSATGSPSPSPSPTGPCAPASPTTTPSGTAKPTAQVSPSAT